MTVARLVWQEVWRPIHRAVETFRPNYPAAGGAVIVNRAGANVLDRAGATILTRA